MGDRVLVTFKKTWEDVKGKPVVQYSPALYCHSEGDQMSKHIKAYGPNMRKGDTCYSLGRFVGYMHNVTGGDKAQYGLGVLPGPSKADVKNNFKSYSHGDGGVFVVDVDTGDVENFDGYEADKEPFQITMETY
jgi:hypothetical protein